MYICIKKALGFNDRAIYKNKDTEGYFIFVEKKDNGTYVYKQVKEKRVLGNLWFVDAGFARFYEFPFHSTELFGCFPYKG